MAVIVHKLATTNPWPRLPLLSLKRMQMNLVDLPLDENYSDSSFSQWIYQNLLEISAIPCEVKLYDTYWYKGKIVA